MISLSAAIPQSAWAASILVLVYSATCLSSSVLLACMLCAHSAKSNYVTLIAVIASIGTTASIVQQVNYACEWRNIKITALQQAKLSLETTTIGLGPLSTGLNFALFEIQFYCYTVNSVLIMFWATALAKGVYNIRFKLWQKWEALISATAKVTAIVLPGVLIGITFTTPVKNSVIAYAAITNVLMLGSLAIGSCIMILVLARYIHSRNRFAGFQESSTTDSPATNSRTGQPTAGKITVDKTLLLRFAVTFVIISGLEVAVVMFEFLRRTNARALATRQEPDFSTSGAVRDILEAMPGVTPSLLAFLLFGTTTQFRKKYAEAFTFSRWRRRRCSMDSTMELTSGLGPGRPIRPARSFRGVRYERAMTK